jgi:hypothetical protein
MTPEDALEAAKLAAMVGGQLRTIDQSATSRGSSPPANKIDINSFVAQVKDPRRKAPPARYLTEVPVGFAEPLPEDYVQNQIPDVVPQFIPPPQQTIPAAMVNDVPVNLKLHPYPNLPKETVNLPHIVNSADQKNSKFEFREDVKSLLTRSDIDSIRNSLKNIDKSLSGLLNFFKNSKSNE